MKQENLIWEIVLQLFWWVAFLVLVYKGKTEIAVILLVGILIYSKVTYIAYSIEKLLK